VLSKLVLALGTIWAVSVAMFLATELIPTNPALAALGISSTPQQRAAFARRAHLDDPLVTRYWHWLTGVLHGNFGQSVISGRPIGPQLAAATVHTVWLAVSALVIGVAVALALAAMGVRRPTGFFDRLTSLGALTVVSTPDFVVATLAILIFAVTLGWFPVVSPDVSGFNLSAMVLPVGALSLGVISYIYRIARATIMDCLSAPYVSSAILNGYSPRRVFWRHIMPNAGVVIINAVGIMAVNLIGSVIVFETVFSYPGLGRLLVSAVTQGDITLTTDIGVVMAVMFVAINLLAEAAAVLLNPRMRTQ